MSIVGLLGLIFIETLTALVSFGAGFFAFNEYFRRRRPFLPFFGVTYILLGLSFAALFTVQFGAIFGLSEEATAAFLPYPYMLASLSGMTSLLALANMYLPSGIRRVLYGIIAGGFITYIALARTQGIPIVHASGLVFADLDMASALRLMGGTFLAYSALVVAPLVVILKARSAGQKAEASNWFILASGIAGAGNVLFRSLFTVVGTPWTLIASFGMMVVLVVLSLIGILSWRHPDRRVIERPRLVFAKSHLLKTAGINTIIFGLLAFLLVSFTASHFLRASMGAQLDLIEAALKARSREFTVASADIFNDAVRLAASPSVAEFFADQDGGPASAALSSFLGSFAPDLTVRLIAPSGTVLFDTGVPDARGAGASRFGSTVFRAAIQGEPATALEEDPTQVTGTTLHAAAPVKDAWGRITGVVMLVDAAGEFLAALSDVVAPSIVVGQGFVVDETTPVYQAGEGLDVLTLHDLSRALFGTDFAAGETDTGLVYRVMRVRHPDGSPDGYLYAYTRQEVLGAEAARIVSIVAILSLLATLFMIAVLVYLTARSLAPIQKLAKAAREIERGNFDVKIGYSSLDELGALSDAFDHMTDTIGQQTVELREALREQRDFLIHTAQEMRTPLNHFRWTLEMLRFGEVGSLNQEQLEMVDQLNRTSDRLQRMVQNIMDANRLTEGTLRPQRKKMALEDIIDDVAGTVVVDVRRKNINLHWRYPDKPFPMVSGDPKMLYRVLTNIVSNAVKYTGRDGHIEISVKRVDEQRPGGKKGPYLQVSIEDNGVGIPENEQGRVFSLFFRSRNVVASDIEGAGLGLFIARQLITLHKGAIWFESQEQKGTTFTFTVPLAGGEEPQWKDDRAKRS